MKLFSFKDYYINKLRKECRREHEKATGCVYEEINGKLTPVKYCKECGKRITGDTLHPNKILSLGCRNGIFTQIKFCSRKCQWINQKRKDQARPEYKENQRKWRQNNYRENRERWLEYGSKRKRNMLYIPLINDVFSDIVGIKSEWHHINNLFVISIPTQLHRKYNGFPPEKHRILLKPIIENIYQINLDSLLSP